MNRSPERDSQGDGAGHDEPPPKRRGGHGKGGGSGRGSRVFKVLCPDSLTSNIIGVQGNSRKAIEEETGARLRISGRDEYYPSSRCRIVIASAGDSTQIMAVLEQIVMKTVEVCNKDNDHGGKGGGKRGEESESLLGKEPGEYVFRAALPAPCTGALIGPRGSRIKALRDKTGAKVFVENEKFQGHQMVRVIGSAESIIAALPQVCDTLEDEMSEEKLAQWAAVMTFDEPDGQRESRRGSGGGKGSRRGSGGEDHRDGPPPRRRSRSRDRHWDQGPPPETGHAENSHGSPLDTIHTLIDQFPPGALEAPYAINCSLPNERVGALIGRRGDYINHVKRTTGVKIVFEEASKNSDGLHRLMTVEGPLVSVYAAHMMMMFKYHEDEAQEEARTSGRGGSRGDEQHIEELQSQLATLQRQLQQVRGDTRDAPRGGKSHSGKGRR